MYMGGGRGGTWCPTYDSACCVTQILFLTMIDTLEKWMTKFTISPKKLNQ